MNFESVFEVVCLFDGRYNIITCSLQRPKKSDTAYPTHPNTDRVTDQPTFLTLKDSQIKDFTVTIAKKLRKKVYIVLPVVFSLKKNQRKVHRPPVSEDSIQIHS